MGAANKNHPGLHTLQDSWSSLPEDVAPLALLRLLGCRFFHVALFRCALFCVKWIPKKHRGKNGKNPASSWKFWYKVLVLINDVCAVLCLQVPPKKAKSAVIRSLFMNYPSFFFPSYLPLTKLQKGGKTAYSVMAKSTCPPRR